MNTIGKLVNTLLLDSGNKLRESLSEEGISTVKETVEIYKTLIYDAYVPTDVQALLNNQ